MIQHNFYWQIQLGPKNNIKLKITSPKYKMKDFFSLSDFDPSMIILAVLKFSLAYSISPIQNFKNPLKECMSE